jgi:predicted O-methyltransferase YrrM
VSTVVLGAGRSGRVADWLIRLVRNPRATLAVQARKLWLRYHVARHALPSVGLSYLTTDNPQIVPPIMDEICMPPYYGPTDHDDFTPLMKIASALQPKVIVELGTAHGNTVANLCNQLEDCRVYTVNAPVELQTGETITFELTRDEIGRVYRNAGFADRVVQIFQNTLHLDLGQYFSEPVVDLAIVDACHDTDYVINDFLKVKPFVRQGGIVLFHDTHPSMAGHLDGSYIGCMLLRAQGFDIRHLSGSWWGVWRNDGPGRA